MKMNSELLLKQRLIEEEVIFTNDMNNAIWLLHDGTLVDGGFDRGMRSEDHRMVEAGIVGFNRYDEFKFWDVVHYECLAIRLCPEDNTALIRTDQPLTAIQKALLSEYDFKVELY